MNKYLSSMGRNKKQVAQRATIGHLRASKKSHQNISIATEKKGNIDSSDVQGQLTP